MSRPVFGAIADDFTGATDLADQLVAGGMRTVQLIGIAGGPIPLDVDAVVIALKSRTVAAGDAVAQSLAALSSSNRPASAKFCSNTARRSIRRPPATSVPSATRSPRH